MVKCVDSRTEILEEFILEDKASFFILLLNVLSFVIIAVGLGIYFEQYNYSKDKSDEKWIYPFLWCVPSAGILVSLAIHVGSSFQFERSLWIVSSFFAYRFLISHPFSFLELSEEIPLPFLVQSPAFAVVEIMLLLFVCFIFFTAYTETEKSTACNGNTELQDITCVVTKDNNQICGHQSLEALCFQLDLGFYFVFMGSMMMIGTQILHITAGCIERSRLGSIREMKLFH